MGLCTTACMDRSLPLPSPFPPQVVAISAKERATLLLQPGGPAGPRWLPSLRPLHFRLAQLLHSAGARQRAPDWGEYAP